MCFNVVRQWLVLHFQCCPYIMLCLGSIGMEHVISESCYTETILLKNYRKMSMKLSFSYNSFVNFHGK